MSYIYEPSGKAKEYGDLALNLYTGCSHGCTYCYVPQATRTTSEAFRRPRLRPIAEKALTREIDKISSLSARPPSVFLCFTCDPYQHIDEEYRSTRWAIETLNGRGIGVRILTKAGLRSLADFDLLAQWPDRNAYGATLTFSDDAASRMWEPGAALPGERLDALSRAHTMGIPTWASLEPVIYPAQSLDLIRSAAPFVDIFKVGKWNHDQAARRPDACDWSSDKIDWAEFARQAVDLLESLGKKYYIKQDLAAYLPPDRATVNE